MQLFYLFFQKLFSLFLDKTKEIRTFNILENKKFTFLFLPPQPTLPPLLITPPLLTLQILLLSHYHRHHRYPSHCQHLWNQHHHDCYSCLCHIISASTTTIITQLPSPPLLPPLHNNCHCLHLHHTTINPPPTPSSFPCLLCCYHHTTSATLIMFIF